MTIYFYRTVDVHGSDGIKTHYVAIDGTEASYNGKEGLRLDEVEYVGVSNAILSNNQGHGMASHKSAKSMKITNSQFISNGANRTWGCGLWMDGLNGTKHKDYNSANVVIEESAFRNSSRFAVCMRNVENATVANTSIINLVDSNATCYYVRNVKAFSTPDTDCNMSSGTFYIPNNDMDINRTITPIPAGPSNVECPNNGISYFDTCCPYTCEYCGKVECADRGENDECCYTETKEKAPACSTGTLPCVQQSEMAADSEMVASS